MAHADYQYRGAGIRETSLGRPLIPGEIVTLEDPLPDEDKALVKGGYLVVVGNDSGDDETNDEYTEEIK